MHLDLLASKAHYIEVFAPYRAVTPHGTEPSVAAIAPHRAVAPYNRVRPDRRIATVSDPTSACLRNALRTCTHSGGHGIC